jgi:uncharacterized damage-inducible protein DinB
MTEAPLPEPWLRGTLTEVPAVPRAVLHALQLASEDVERWCGTLTEEELNAEPFGLPSVAFQIHHLSGSIDRLLAYAEGKSLDEKQIQALKSEHTKASRTELFAEFKSAIESAEERIRKLSISPSKDVFEQSRSVGKKRLPTTVGGLFVHIADHTQRHVGQAITTAKVVTNMRAQAKTD